MCFMVTALILRDLDKDMFIEARNSAERTFSNRRPFRWNPGQTSLLKRHEDSPSVFLAKAGPQDVDEYFPPDARLKQNTNHS